MLGSKMLGSKMLGSPAWGSVYLLACCAGMACGNGTPTPTPDGAAGSSTGGSSTGGSSMQAGTSNAGRAGSGGGGVSGSGGSQTGGASGSSGATSGAGGGAGSTMGGSDGGGDGGEGGNDGGTPRFVCPTGALPAPMVVSSQSVCQNFDFDYTWNEGPTWVESQQAFFFTNFVAGSASGGHIMKYTPGGSCEVYIRDVGCNGLAASNDGNLLAACQQTRSVLRFDLTSKQPTTVADEYMGTMLDTPNDLIQHSNGSVYFTNPTNELAGRPVGVGRATFRVDPSGEVSKISDSNSNGIALSPDEKKLYVLLSGMWDLDAQGVPSNQQAMFTMGDGMAVDCAGNVYANGSIFSPAGQNIGSWGTGTNLAFGGEDGETVLVTGPGTQLRELVLNVPGLP